MGDEAQAFEGGHVVADGGRTQLGQQLVGDALRGDRRDAVDVLLDDIFQHLALALGEPVHAASPLGASTLPTRVLDGRSIPSYTRRVKAGRRMG